MEGVKTAGKDVCGLKGPLRKGLKVWETWKGQKEVRQDWTQFPGALKFVSLLVTKAPKEFFVFRRIVRAQETIVGLNLALTTGSGVQPLWGVQLSPSTSMDDFPTSMYPHHP